MKLRRQIAEPKNLKIRCVDDELCPGEYIVGNPSTANEYKVVYRGANSEWNYCSCWDFKTSRLGTCKHIEAVKKWLGTRKEFHVHREVPPYTSVYLSYKGERCVKIRIGSDNKEDFEQLAKDYFDSNCVLKETAYPMFGTFLTQAKKISDTFRCYKDAVDFILDKREKESRTKIVETYDDNKLDSLLKVNLYPYQKEGIRFAAKASKVIIADEMGLGKTIQAIGTAELLRKEGLIESVLILCPTSLKYQWRSEIRKFTNAEVCVIEGAHSKRKEAYNRPETYKIISYNSACNDIKILGKLQTDMLIMDEVQRLKNWNTQFSMAARKIESDYSVILSGTPLENKLDELYSIVEFVDNFRLAPYHSFKEKHILSDESGKVLGYKGLNEIGRQLGDILIRRRKRDVKLQMPERFVDGDKFCKIMETVSSFVSDEDNNQSDERLNTETIVDNEENEEMSGNRTTTDKDDSSKDLSDGSILGISENDTDNTDADTPSAKPRKPSRPKELVEQGVSFLSGLAETLKSPEATAALVDSITEKDEKTGETSIKIPVDSKETVENLLNMIGKLFAK